MSYSCPNDWKRVQIVDQFDMALKADAATERSFAEARRKLNNPDPTEPDLVRSFFIHALDDIEADWNATLAGYSLRLKISGVYCHQTPMVRPMGDLAYREARNRGIIPKPRKRTCELGDFLFIVSHEGSTKGTGNAIMFQAKKGFNASADPLQRVLYEHSPKFEYRRSTPSLNGQERVLTPKSDTKLAYWDLHTQVHPQLSRRSTTAIYAADSRIDDRRGASFGDTLTKLIFGAAGTGFSIPTSGKAWSRIIGDLVGITANRILTNNPINTRGTPRGLRTDRLAAALSGDGQSVLVRNSLAEALLSLSDDYSEAAEKLQHIDSLDGHLIKRRGKPPRPPRSNSGDDDDNEGGVSTVFIRCGVEE